MISALEIGLALSVVASLVVAYVSLQPKPKPVRIRVRDAGSHRRPNA
ncbi:hypothetical protein [Brevundimonas sp.]